MVQVTPTLEIDDNEIHFEFTRASGPGGQHVNKASTAVQIRFDVLNSPSLPEDVRQRLLRLGGNRVTQDGVLVIDARQYRSQERNRQDAVQRLVELVGRAARKPKRRRRTQPTATSKRRRLEAKRRRGQTKQLRRRVRHPED